MEQEVAEIPKIGVKCVVCGYSWKTRTKLNYISCPNCRHTNKIVEATKAFAEVSE
jgi:DNA-directed RNA polymerase subunit RPC12/RpoP